MNPKYMSLGISEASKPNPDAGDKFLLISQGLLKASKHITDTGDKSFIYFSRSI